MSGVHVLLPDPWRRGDARLSQSEEVEALYIRYIGNHMDGVFEAVISQRTLGVNFPPRYKQGKGFIPVALFATPQKHVIAPRRPNRVLESLSSEPQAEA